MVGRSLRGHCLPFVAAVLACAALPAWAAGAAPPEAVASKDLHAWEAGDDPAALKRLKFRNMGPAAGGRVKQGRGVSP